MANVKFSQFTNQSATPTTFIVGYDGATNVRIPFSGVPEVLYIQEATLTTAAQTTLPSSKSITNNSVQSFVTRITAIKTSTGDVWCHEFRGAIKQIASVTSIVDTVTDELIAEDAATSGWSAVLEAGVGVLDIKVTSGDALEIKWKAETIFNEVLI